jgi:hypothetical protein
MDLATALRIAKKMDQPIRNLSVGHNIWHKPEWPRDQFDRRRSLYSPDAILSLDWEVYDMGSRAADGWDVGCNVVAFVPGNGG